MSETNPLISLQIDRGQHGERPRGNGGREDRAAGEAEPREGRPRHAETAKRGRRIRRGRALQISRDTSSGTNWNWTAPHEGFLVINEELHV